jgi:Arc/MetJ-type ribon-helix-helix transcriptional regulator
MYYYEKEPDAESGPQSPSARIRFPRQLLIRIDTLVAEPGQPYLDRSEAIRSLIVDGFKYREAGNAS